MTEDVFRVVMTRLEDIRRDLRQMRVELRKHRKPQVPDMSRDTKEIYTLVAEFCSPGGGEPSVEDVSVSEIAAGLFPGLKADMRRKREIGRALRLLGYQRYRTSGDGRKERWRVA